MRGRVAGLGLWRLLLVADGNTCCLPADYYRCLKTLGAKGKDTKACQWYYRVYKSLCPISWVRGVPGPRGYPPLCTQ
uniref:Uncharacterized protein n=1 Tax=Chelydra serpentina TaxID=8475 RepID=A0A8C3XQ19_CHESE